MPNIPRQAHEEDPAYRVRKPVGPPPLDSESEVEQAKQNEDMEEGEYLQPAEIRPTEPMTLQQMIGTWGNRQYRSDRFNNPEAIFSNPLDLLDATIGSGLDKAVGVHDWRMKIVEPISNINPIAGVAAEMLVPGAADLVSVGTAYPYTTAKRVATNLPEMQRLASKVNWKKTIDEVFEGTQRVWDDVTGWFYKPKLATANGADLGQQSAKPLMSRGVDPPDGSINIGPSGKPLQHTAGNPYLTYAERKGIYPLPSKDEVIRRQKLGRDWQSIDAEKVSTLSTANKRDWSLYERDEAAYFQNPRWPRDQEFNKLGDLIKSELEKLYPDIPLSYWRNHHTNPVKQGARLLNGLKPEFREKGIKILLEEGLFAGHDPKQLAVIPKEIHRKIHKFINQRVGSKYSVQYLESTLPKGVKLEDVPWPDREQFIRLYARAIKDSQTKIYDMMTALAVNKKYGPNVLPEVLANLNSKVDATDVGLDDLLKQVKSELNLQEISGTVPKINLQKLAEQYTPDSSIQTRLVKDLASGKYTRQQLKRKYPGFKAEQLDLFDQ